MVTPDQPPLQHENASSSAAREIPSPKQVDMQRCASGSQHILTPPEFSPVECSPQTILNSDTSERSDNLNHLTFIQPESFGTEFSRAISIEEKFNTELKAIEKKFKAELKAKDKQIEECNDRMDYLWSIISNLMDKNAHLIEKITQNKEIAININIETTAENQSMSETRKIYIKQKNGIGYCETAYTNYVGDNIHNYAFKQNLTEAAKEIQELLQQLEQEYTPKTPLEKQRVVTEAIEQIEKNPTLKERVIAALKSAGTEGIRELVDNPLINILLAALEGWQEAE